jgi:hypothetical protein
MIRNDQHTTLASSVLSSSQIDAVAGGVIQRPDGGTCTDPIIPLGPWFPNPTPPTQDY